MLSLKMALRSIAGNKLRAALTMLGIIIGVMALVVLVSLVNGATSSVTDVVSALGSDMLSVSISDDKGYPLSIEDVQKWVDEEESIGLGAVVASDNLTCKYETESDEMTVYGVTPEYYDIEGLSLSLGRFLKYSDFDNHTRVCVLNYSAATKLVGFEDCVGREVSINGMKFTVVGVLGEDTSLLAAFTSGVKQAYIPYSSLTRVSSSVSSTVNKFVVSAAEGHPMDELEKVISEKLYERFEQDEDAYEVSSMKQMEDAMASITSSLSIMLGGIAGISLLVGGIGIMNIMLVTVTERTREIGIRKAIGASRGNILRQFLLEAVVLCMLGCAIGIFISWCLLRVVAVVASSLDMSFGLNFGVVMIAVVFCFLLGVIFGLYPANKAAKMKPIDALHYGG